MSQAYPVVAAASLGAKVIGVPSTILPFIIVAVMHSTAVGAAVMSSRAMVATIMYSRPIGGAILSIIVIRVAV